MSDAYGEFPPFEASSDTSFEAASSMDGLRIPLRERVYRFIAQCGTYGATDEEIQLLLKMRANTERPRRRELELEGRIVKTAMRRQGDSGRSAGVYTLTPEGEAV